MERSEEKKLGTLSPFEVKNTLIELAESDHNRSMINAGRGNPNWVATVPREGFMYLGLFALEESRRKFTSFDGFGGIGSIEGLSDRFDAFAKNNEGKGVQFLIKSVEHAVNSLNIDKDKLLLEWVDGILGDNYPVPDRMLVNAEKIVHSYLLQEMSSGMTPPKGKFDIFAVEGGTAAMVYIFNSLKASKLLNAGDTIAIGAPIFTPYIEMPELEDYDLQTIEITADSNNGWQMPDSEIEKLRSPDVKAFFLVNPMNPPSVRLSDDSLRKIAEIANERPDLILLTDDVYGTFTDGFTSLAMIAPKNTILVYSFSKFYGATGWRLGVIALHEDNNFDTNLMNVTGEEKDRIAKRYGGISLKPTQVKLIDRLVADSRAVALNHTAGLSTPQQIQMTLFAMYSLLEEGAKYKDNAKKIVRDRYAALLEDASVKPMIKPGDPNGAFYYIEVDVERIARLTHGDEFMKWLEENHDPLDVVIRLAEEKGIVAMPGGGFDDIDWSFRLSLANLNKEDYAKITGYAREVLEKYFNEFNKA